MAGYFKNIAEGVKTTLTGMALTLRHARDARRRRKANNIQLDNFFEVQTGMVTVQYPHETVAIPDNGRYRLHNEMDDCIVCDKCAKVCPVDCIDIEPIKATEEVGRASDGSVIRLYAARFDIDMAKCCYCGLCTTVCPTECLTMTKTFDYSEFDVREMVYAYGNLTPEEAQEKRELLEQFQLEKAQGKARPAAAVEAPAPAAKPAFRPVMKPKTAAPAAAAASHQETEKPTTSSMPFHPRNWTPDFIKNSERLHFTYGKPKPLKRAAETTDPVQSAIKAASAAAFRPTIKPAGSTPAPGSAAASKPAFKPTMKPKGAEATEPGNKAEAPKPAFRPTMKPKAAEAAGTEKATEAPKPAFRPTMKPKGDETAKSEKTTEAAKPAFRPTMKPKAAEASGTEKATEAPKPAFRPTMKPKGDEVAKSEKTTEAPKPAFRPTMKPKAAEATGTEKATEAPKPAFRPTMKPKGDEVKSENTTEAPKPAFRPTMRPKAAEATDTAKITEAPKPAFRPTMKPKESEATEPENKPAPPKPAFRPTMKSRPVETQDSKEAGAEVAKPANKAETTLKQVFRPSADLKMSRDGNRPVFRPQPAAEEGQSPAVQAANGKFTPAGYKAPRSEARPSFGVSLPAALVAPPKAGSEHQETEPKQPASPSSEAPTGSVQPVAKPKPAFRPTMKPKK